MVRSTLLIYAVVLGGFLFYVSNHPADILFRLWIPLVVLLFGVVAKAICFTVDLVKVWWRERKAAPAGDGSLDLRRFWPVIVLAVLLGYSWQMISRGSEQVVAVAKFLREKEPLAFYPFQPRDLLAHARPGDQVLYTSFQLMDYYLINGGLSLGAVYYHPALESSLTKAGWLSRPDLRFAVTFQPTVYHPSFEGRDEPWWWITMPNFRYSPLNQGRTQGPVAREGKIPANLYRWLEVKPATREAPKTLRLNIDNPGDESVLDVALVDREG